MKRQHQIDFDRSIESIVAGNPARKIVDNVTPWGGKSALPVIASKLIDAGKRGPNHA